MYQSKRNFSWRRAISGWHFPSCVKVTILVSTSHIMTIQFLLLLGYSILIFAGNHHLLFKGDRTVGTMLLLTGLAILSAAIAAYRRTVGTFRVKVSPEPAGYGDLITDGIYSKIRHPIYTSALLIMAGGSLLMQEFWSLVVAFGMIGFYYWKSCFEEKLLAVRFAEYARYQKQTGRFLPRRKQN